MMRTQAYSKQDSLQTQAVLNRSDAPRERVGSYRPGRLDEVAERIGKSRDPTPNAVR